jgi:hypothetical protein
MADKQIRTQNGKLFKLSESSGQWTVYEVDVGFLNNYKNVGKTKSLKDAIDIVRAVSGREVREMSDW